MAQDVVSWLLENPESAAIGRSLHDFIGKESTMGTDEIHARIELIQAQLEQLKTAMPQDQRFISLCIHAVGQIAEQHK